MLCHVSVHSGAFCLRHRARDPISVAFFDPVTLFISVTGPGFAPIAVVTFIYCNYAQKNILKTLTANFMNNFHVGNVCFPYKALE